MNTISYGRGSPIKKKGRNLIPSFKRHQYKCMVVGWGPIDAALVVRQWLQRWLLWRGGSIYRSLKLCTQ